MFALPHVLAAWDDRRKLCDAARRGVGRMPDILMKKSEAGRIRDGEVIVYDVEGAIRFRNDERGEAAL